MKRIYSARSASLSLYPAADLRDITRQGIETGMTQRQNSTTGLVDPFDRRVEYLRLSVTDKCNLRCFYCLPEGFRDFEEPDNWLRFDEIERVVAAFADLGVNRIRLTGGEPLVRRDLPQLVSRLAALDGVEDLSLSTNATLLQRHAGELREAGISRINVSLQVDCSSQGEGSVILRGRQM